MKKAGIINAPLSEIVARLGHTDKLVICDSGLPIPTNGNVLDLSVSKNIPRFTDVLRVVVEELAVEKFILAEELFTSGNGVVDEINSIMGDTKLEKVSHEVFKRLTKTDETIFFVRTGEMSPYANTILVCGVTF